MDEERRKALEAAGYRVGDAADFLGLTRKESRLIDDLLDGEAAWQHPDPAGEACRLCGAPAPHKVGEETGPVARHNFTAYLCCRCFGWLFGGTAWSWCSEAAARAGAVHPGHDGVS